MIFTGWGTARLLKEHFDTETWIAIAGGLFFALMSQIQANAVLHSCVFNFYFPIFFVWFLDLFGAKSFKGLILPLVGMHLVLWTAYPVLTLPFYVPLHFGLILVLRDSAAVKALGWKKLFFYSGIVWFGYILLFTPVIYALLEVAPYVSRIYENHVVDKAAVWAFLRRTLHTILFGLNVHSLFAPLAAVFVLLAFSKRLRLLALFWLLVVLSLSFVTSPLFGLLSDTLFQKMDLDHLSWLFIPLNVLLIFVGLDEIRKKCTKTWTLTLLVIGALLIYLLLTLAAPINPAIRDYAIRGKAYGSLITILVAAYFLIAAMQKAEKFRSFFKKSDVYAAPFIFMAMSVLSAILLRQYQARYYLLPTLYEFFVISLLAAGAVLIARYRYPQFLRLQPAGAITTIAIFLCLVFTVRLVRYSCLHSENVPYKENFASYSFLEKYRPVDQPYRFATVYEPLPHVLLNYGLETADARVLLSFRQYKDLFKLIIKPQLQTPEQESAFDRYFYNLYFAQGSSNLGLNYNLLAMLNVRYIFSTATQPNLDAYASKSLIEYNEFNRNPIYIYELKNWFKRAFLVPRADIFENEQEVLTKLSREPIGTFQNTALFVDSDIDDSVRSLAKASSKQTPPSPDSPRITLYTPDEIEIEGVVHNPSFLVISNNFHPKWHAAINGVSTRIYRANHAFQSVLISQPGKFKVRLEYKDPLLWRLHLFIPLGLLLISVPALMTAWTLRLKKGSELAT